MTFLSADKTKAWKSSPTFLTGLFRSFNLKTLLQRRRDYEKIVLTIVAILLLLAAYLTLWPVPIEPVSWNAPMPPGYSGPHAVNTKLANLKMISLGTEEGPEHIAIGKDGKLYTTVASGNVLRMNPDGSAQEVFVNTGGRVLVLTLTHSGNLIAADAVKGLLSISPDRKITVLTDKGKTGNRSAMPTQWWWPSPARCI